MKHSIFGELNFKVLLKYRILKYKIFIKLYTQRAENQNIKFN